MVACKARRNGQEEGALMRSSRKRAIFILEFLRDNFIHHAYFQRVSSTLFYNPFLLPKAKLFIFIGPKQKSYKKVTYINFYTIKSSFLYRRSHVTVEKILFFISNLFSIFNLILKKLVERRKIQKLSTQVTWKCHTLG